MGTRDMNDNGLRLSRQADMIPEMLTDISVAIIGVGSIGSNAAHLLASMGIGDVWLFDPDEINEENLYPGFFSQRDIGEGKGMAVSESIHRRYGLTYAVSGSPFEERIGAGTLEEWDVVIIATDTLESRQDIWVDYANEICNHVWVDARMGGTLATVYAIEMADPNAVAEYRAELADGRAGELPCGMKATAPLTKGFITGMIGQVLYCIANGQTPPFMQRYDLGHHLYIAQDEAPQRRQDEREPERV
jgi:hypothetical protein